METVGFIGLGNLGTPMARNIQKAGYEMVVHDVREGATKPLLEGGARLGGSPAEVARLCDVTITSVPGPREVEGVAAGREGILEGIRDGSVYVDLSTSRPSLIRELEPRFRQKGAHVLDCPVLSTPAAAADRSLIAMVGGEREVYERIRPILDAFAGKVIYAGELGSGTVCKLVHNMMNFCVRQVLAEGMTLGVKAGLDLQVILESGERGFWHPLTAKLAETAFLDKYEPPSFTLALSRKDIGLATELARDVNVPLPIASAVEQMMMQAMGRGWGEKDSVIAFRLQEELAGVEVRSGRGA